jgi:hypothetical protein
LLLAACGGGGGASDAAVRLGPAVRSAFLKTLNAELNDPGWSARIGSQCRDQQTGIPIGQVTSADLSAAGKVGMLFHCSVDVVSASYGQLGELYYLSLYPGGRWSALWEPIPLDSYDVKDPCAGAACTAVFPSLSYGDDLAGDTSGGHDTSPAAPSTTESATSSSTTSTASSTATTATGRAAAAHPASAGDLRALTAAATSEDPPGMTTPYLPDGYYLGEAKVTNNGWAVATPLARSPADQGDGVLIFKRAAGLWKVVTGGSSDFVGVPAAVLHALFQ